MDVCGNVHEWAYSIDAGEIVGAGDAKGQVPSCQDSETNKHGMNWRRRTRAACTNVSRMTPICKHVRVPNLRMTMVAKGANNKAGEGNSRQ